MTETTGIASGPVSVLATSRQRLRVDGEHVIDLDVLDPDHSEEFFADRLRSLGTSAPHDASAIAGLCERLDHLPLAIELASGQARVLGVDALSSMLDSRLQLLSGGNRGDRPHRTLAHAIASSVDMLEAELRETLFRLSVFAGPFDLDAALAISSAERDVAGVEPVHQLVELVERSLIVVDHSDSTSRYRLLESVRLFCADRLVDSRAARDAHLRHYRSAAEARLAKMRTPAFEDDFHGFADDWDNNRSAIDHAIEAGEAEEALALLLATVDWADAVRRREHADWSRRVLAIAPPSPQRQRLTAALARSIVLDDRDEYRRLLADVDDESSYEALTARAQTTGGTSDDQTLRNMVRFTGGYHEFYERAQESFWQVRAGGDPTDAVDRLRVMASSAGPIGATHTLSGEACLALAEHDYTGALELIDRLDEQCRRHGLELFAAASQHFRMIALTRHPEPEQLAAELASTFRRYQELRLWTMVTKDAPAVASVLARSGRHAEALILLGAHDAGSHTGGTWVATLHEQLAHVDDRDQHLAAGRAMDPPTLCRFAIDELTTLHD